MLRVTECALYIIFPNIDAVGTRRLQQQGLGVIPGPGTGIHCDYSSVPPSSRYLAVRLSLLVPVPVPVSVPVRMSLPPLPPQRLDGTAERRADGFQIIAA